jgi:hypothetical protein
MLGEAGTTPRERARMSPDDRDDEPRRTEAPANDASDGPVVVYGPREDLEDAVARAIAAEAGGAAAGDEGYDDDPAALPDGATWVPRSAHEHLGRLDRALVEAWRRVAPDEPATLLLLPGAPTGVGTTRPRPVWYAGLVLCVARGPNEVAARLALAKLVAARAGAHAARDARAAAGLDAAAVALAAALAARTGRYQAVVLPGIAAALGDGGGPASAGAIEQADEPAAPHARWAAEPPPAGVAAVARVGRSQCAAALALLAPPHPEDGDDPAASAALWLAADTSPDRRRARWWAGSTLPAKVGRLRTAGGPRGPWARLLGLAPAPDEPGGPAVHLVQVRLADPESAASGADLDADALALELAAVALLDAYAATVVSTSPPPVR